MKKLFRETKLALFLLLFVGVIFACVFASNNNVVKAEDVVYEEELYKLSYSNDKVTLLLSTDFSEYLDITREDLSTLKHAVKDVLVNAISDDIDLSKYGTSNKSRYNGKTMAPAPFTYGDDVDVSVLTNILVAQLTSVEVINENFLGGTTYDVMIKYYIDNYADGFVASVAGTPQAMTKNAVLDIIKTQLVNTISNQVSAKYDAASINQEEKDLALAAVSTKITNLVNEVKGLSEENKSVEVTLGDVKDIINTVEINQDVIDYVKTSGIKDDVNTIIMASSDEEITSFLVEVETDTIIDLVKETEIVNNDNITEIFNTVGIDNVVKIAENFGLDKLADLAEAANLDKEDLTETINNNLDQITVKTMIEILKSIYVGDDLIFSKDNGFNVSGIKSFVSKLPRPSEIQYWTDEQMKVTWDVKIVTPFGDIDTTLTVGFFGDCSKVRRIAQILADHVSVYNDNGTYTFELIGPAKSGEIIAKFLNGDYISDELKQRIFEDLGYTVDELYNRFNDTTADEYVDLLKQVDYKKLLGKVLDGETLSSYLGVTVSDEQIDDVIDFVIKVARKFEDKTYADILAILDDYIDVSKLQNEKIESLFNYAIKALNKIDDGTLSSAKIREWLNSETSTNQSVYTRIDKLANYENYLDKLKSYVTRVYDRLPERYKEKTIVQYYKETCTLDASASINVTKAIELLPKDLEDAIGVFFDGIPERVNVRFILTLPDVYKVTYIYGTETKIGFLPTGAILNDYPGVEEVNNVLLQGWADENGDPITVMPDRDLVVTAIAQFSAATTGDITRDYDPDTTSTISVSVIPATGNYTYQWYKDGEIITGATNASIDVINVLDSGAYYCVVTNENLETTTSDVANVTINKAKIDVSGIYWEQNVSIPYDGTQHTLKLNGTIDTEKLSYKRSKYSLTPAGQYTAHIEFTIKDAYVDNYEIYGTVADTAWEITPIEIDVSGYQWPTTKSYVYTGSQITHQLVSEINPLIKATYKNYKYTGVNKLTASVTFAAAKSNAVDSIIIVGSVPDDQWEITPMIIDVSTYQWSTTTEFVYDGSAKSIAITTAPHEKFTIAYENNSFTNAGSYTAKATITSSTKNIQPSVTTLEKNWSISKADYNMTGVYWNYTDALVYNGSEQKVEVVGLPTGVTVSKYTDNAKTNAGKYIAKVEFAYDTANYNAPTLSDKEWEIVKADFDMAGAYWKYTKAYTYNGSEQKIEVVGLPAGLTVSKYTDNAKTNVGKYLAKVEFAYDAANYNAPSLPDKEWEIKKADYDMSAAKWNYTTEIVYNGSEQKIEVIGLPTGVTVKEYTDNAKTNAGFYTAKVTFNYDTNNYNEPTLSDELWEIKKANFDLSNVKWTYTEALTYNLTAQTVTLTNLPEGLTVNYENNSKTDAGKYTAVAKFVVNNANYNTPANMQIEWEIAAVKIYVSHYTWSIDNVFTYDGKDHTVTLSIKAHEMLDIRYIDNVKREVGTYTAKVNVMLKQEAGNNYEIVGTIPTFEWSIKAPSEIDKRYDYDPYVVDGVDTIFVKSIDGTDASYELQMSEYDVSQLDLAYQIGSTIYKTNKAYDIHFEKGNVETKVTGNFKIKMLIPEELRDKAQLGVLHIDDKGNATVVESERVGDYMEFDAKEFSVYVIVELREKVSLPLIIACAVLVLVILIAIICYFARKKEDEDGNLDPFFIKLASCSPEIKSCYYQLKQISKAYEEHIKCTINAYVESFDNGDDNLATIEVKNAKLVVRAANKKVVVKDTMTLNKGKALMMKAFKNADFTK